MAGSNPSSQISLDLGLYLEHACLLWAAWFFSFRRPKAGCPFHSSIVIWAPLQPCDFGAWLCATRFICALFQGRIRAPVCHESLLFRSKVKPFWAFVFWANHENLTSKMTFLKTLIFRLFLKGKIWAQIDQKSLLLDIEKSSRRDFGGN